MVVVMSRGGVTNNGGLLDWWVAAGGEAERVAIPASTHGNGVPVGQTMGWARAPALGGNRNNRLLKVRVGEGD